MEPYKIAASSKVEFGIRTLYRHRRNNEFFDATGSQESWQKEVYEAAARSAEDANATVVFDVGCGSGYKLMKYFGKLRTVGFDVEQTVTMLKQKYPGRDWRCSNFTARIDEAADIVVCADVIEHIPNPDQLMEFLSRIRFRKLFLSTPERHLVYGFDQSGPPLNKAHCREWTMDELAGYVRRGLTWKAI